MKREKYLKKLIQKFKNAGNDPSTSPFNKSTSFSRNSFHNTLENIINPGSREPSAEELSRSPYPYSR
jgi:hypothetical protein